MSSVAAFSDTTTEVWSPAMEMGTNLVYKLSSHPDQFANDLLQGIASKCFGAAPNGYAPSSGRGRQILYL